MPMTWMSGRTGPARIMIHKTSVDAALSEVKELQTDGAEATALLEAASKVLPALKSVDVEAIRTTVRPHPRRRPHLRRADPAGFWLLRGDNA